MPLSLEQIIFSDEVKYFHLLLRIGWSGECFLVSKLFFILIVRLNVFLLERSRERRPDSQIKLRRLGYLLERSHFESVILLVRQDFIDFL